MWEHIIEYMFNMHVTSMCILIVYNSSHWRMHSGEGGGGASYYGLVVVARIRHGCGLLRVNLKYPHRTASIFYM